MADEQATNRFRSALASAKRKLLDDRTGRAWVVGIIAVLLYLLIRNDTFGAIMLAFLGVTITFIVLPDPKRDVDDALRQNNVWFAAPEQLQSALNSEQLQATARRIYTASLPPVPDGLERYLSDDLPIGQAAHQVRKLWEDPTALVLNMRYDLELTYDEAGLSGHPVYSTRSTTVSERWMSFVDGAPYAAFCRTTEMFGTEFDVPNCLTRELVELTPEAWAAALERPEAHFAATMVVRSSGASTAEHRLTNPRFELDTDIVRVRFDLPEALSAATGRMWIFEEYLHPLPATLRCYGAIFSSYFTAGSTSISLRLDDPRAQKLTALSYMSNLAGYELSADKDVLPVSGASELRASLSFHDKVFWPGSGAVFLWETAQ